MKKLKISQEQIMELLHKCYELSMNGVPGAKSCNELAYEYLIKYRDPVVAAKKMVNQQIIKCTTSGFITNIGGIITLPAGFPINLLSVWYMQIQMIGTLAVVGGFDLNDDEVETLTYLCFVDASMSNICKKAGIEIANAAAGNAVKKVPVKVLRKINNMVGKRIITKSGSTGVINLIEVVPIVGGIVGASADYITTDRIAKRAYKTFILKILD